MNTEKSAKFLKLATARTNKALKSIQLVSNLANKKHYEYSDEQAQKIIRALQNEVNDLKDAFQRQKKDEEKFTL